MENRTGEWFRQAAYDLDTAEYMYEGGRYFYAVFMCHLAIEKALKGLYYEKLRQIPPKVHSLVYLLKEIGLNPPEEEGKFLIKLSEAGIFTRYPDKLSEIQEVYSQDVVKDILAKGNEVIMWIKMQL